MSSFVVVVVMPGDPSSSSENSSKTAAESSGDRGGEHPQNGISTISSAINIPTPIVREQFRSGSVANHSVDSVSSGNAYILINCLVR